MLLICIMLQCLSNAGFRYEVTLIRYDANAIMSCYVLIVTSFITTAYYLSFPFNLVL